MRHKRNSKTVMAVFQYDNKMLPYEVAFAPFSHDLLLLQGARFNADFWKPLVEDLNLEPAAGGRIVRCDSTIASAEFLKRFMGTLGLHSVHVVAIGDASELVKDLEKSDPDIFARVLLLTQGASLRGAELEQQVREFCGL